MSEVIMETILRDQLHRLAEALDLKQHRIHRGRGFYDYMFFGLDADTDDLSRALCRMGLQHTKRPLGRQQVITVKFIWTPERLT
jgi:hypothetical protein